MPADVGGVDPFLVEVKVSKELERPERGSGIPGASFARRTLRDLCKLASRVPIGARPWTPVMFGRSGQGDGPSSWRVWMPLGLLEFRYAAAGLIPIHSIDWRKGPSAFVELPWWAFFPMIGAEEEWQ
jgi:hypothetical protein